MMRKIILYLILILFALNSFAIITTNNEAQSFFLKIKKDAPKVFIDCFSCDMDYIRKNITFVNYVIEPKKADVYILITLLRTGSGGRKYTIEFKGQNRFKGINDKLFVITNQSDTEDKRREKIVKGLKAGLFQYARRTRIAEYLDIMFTGIKETKQIKDKWNNWVFDIGFGLSKGGEKSYSYEALNYSAGAKRVTEASRIELRFFNRKSTSIFKMGESELKSERKHWLFRGTYVGAINEHFSFGGKIRTDSSSYYNRKIRYQFSPAIEYNIFPYSEATSKIFRINYGMGIEKVEYYETTIYNKDKETLWFHSLVSEFGIIQRWGDANIGVDFQQYLHDTKKYSLEFSGNLSWRISKGVSFFAYSSYSVIHNQLYLPKGDLTQEEILLRTSALETNYDYYISLGIRITFGSIYNNVVNPRFGY